MNFSLATKKKKGKTSAASIGFGLNSRSTATTAKSNVFGEASDDEDGEQQKQPLSGRDLVNQEIAKEQAALRKRAQAALATSSTDPKIYDYDGAYDSFQPAKDAAAKQPQEERKSKYIGDLLQAAKKRGRERDVIHERKVAREQAEEDAQEEYQGKEKFITKAYKRKLEERKGWEADEKERERQEDENDVTKKTSAGAAFATFYGNLNRNVAMGGGDDKNDEEGNDVDKEIVNANNDDVGGLGFMAGFERSDEPAAEQESDSKIQAKEDKGTAGLEESKLSSIDPEESGLSMRERRGKKVAEARIRYLERKRLALQ